MAQRLEKQPLHARPVAFNLGLKLVDLLDPLQPRTPHQRIGVRGADFTQQLIKKVPPHVYAGLDALVDGKALKGLQQHRRSALVAEMYPPQNTRCHPADLLNHHHGIRR